MNYTIASIIEQVFTLAATLIASGVVTTLLTQALKWKAIAIPATKYPVQVAAVLSLIVSAGGMTILGGVPLTDPLSYVVFSGATLLVATQSYDVAKDVIAKLASENQE